MMLVLAGWARPVCAQTTQPAPAEWDQAVQTFASALASSDDHSKQQLSDDCIIRSFDSSTKQLADLTAHTGGTNLLAAKAYLYPGGNIAGDIATAVAGSIASDDVKKLLTPAEGGATDKANSVAARWVQSLLSPADADPFAVMVFYTGDVTHADTTEAQILFVMVRGRKDSSGSYVISQVVYGNSQQAAVVAAR
jgi:hypothetical protein